MYLVRVSIVTNPGALPLGLLVRHRRLRQCIARTKRIPSFPLFKRPSFSCLESSVHLLSPLNSITAPDSFRRSAQIFHHFFTTAVCFAAILSASLMSQW